MKHHVRMAVAFFLVAALIGWLLRSVQSGWLILNFKYLLHTHSHVALIGWLYNGCFIILQRTIIGDNARPSYYNRLYWITQITILGMLFSFPFQGYGAVSITFSTLYIFASYVLGWRAYIDVGSNAKPVRILVRGGVVFLFLTSIGPFALGYFMSQGLGDSIYYKLSIYWFLHFLYNGFFLMIIAAYAIKYIPPTRSGRLMAWLILGSTGGLFLISTLWTNPPNSIYIVSSISCLVQLVIFGFWMLSRPHLPEPRTTVRILAGTVLLVLFLKLFFQTGANIPVIQDFINSTVPYSVIGFIHLVMLGFFSLGILVIFIHHKLIETNTIFYIGLWTLIVSIGLSEIMLFSQSLLATYRIRFFESFFEQLTIVSTLLPIGIMLLLISQLIPGQKQH